MERRWREGSAEEDRMWQSGGGGAGVYSHTRGDASLETFNSCHQRDRVNEWQRVPGDTDPGREREGERGREKEREGERERERGREKERERERERERESGERLSGEGRKKSEREERRGVEGRGLTPLVDGGGMDPDKEEGERMS